MTWHRPQTRIKVGCNLALSALRPRRSLGQTATGGFAMRSAKLVNQNPSYISISRVRRDARVFTNDLQALERAVARDP
jgi:hypothetical protein